MIVTLTVAEPCAGTVTLGALNTTCVSGSQNESGGNVAGPVAMASSCDRSYVTPDAELLLSVRVFVTGPAWLSPSESLPGRMVVVESIASSMSTMPAP